MHKHIFSIRQIVNGGCSGVCLMEIEARTSSDAQKAAVRKARRMGMQSFIVTEVK